MDNWSCKIPLGLDTRGKQAIRSDLASIKLSQRFIEVNGRSTLALPRYVSSRKDNWGPQMSLDSRSAGRAARILRSQAQDTTWYQTPRQRKRSKHQVQPSEQLDDRRSNPKRLQLLLDLVPTSSRVRCACRKNLNICNSSVALRRDLTMKSTYCSVVHPAENSLINRLQGTNSSRTRAIQREPKSGAVGHHLGTATARPNASGSICFDSKSFRK